MNLICWCSALETVRVYDLWMSLYVVDILNPDGSCFLLLLLQYCRTNIIQSYLIFIILAESRFYIFFGGLHNSFVLIRQCLSVLDIAMALCGFIRTEFLNFYSNQVIHQALYNKSKYNKCQSFLICLCAGVLLFAFVFIAEIFTLVLRMEAW